MMAAHQGKTGSIEIDGMPIGVKLAPNSVGQHHMGIDRLLRDIGANTDDPHGIRIFDEHVATIVPHWERDDRSYDEKLYLDVGPRPKRFRGESATLCVEGNIAHAVEESRRYSPLSVVTGAWDDSSFAVRGYDDAGRRIVDLLQEGVATCDLAIWISDGLEWGPGSLCVVRRSLVPQPLVEHFDAKALDLRRLYVAADATGIEERLKGIGPMTMLGRMKPYYALSPAWIDPETAARSAHPVRFFLNPAEQQANNHGWFTVEDLDEWIQGRGPIPKHQQEGKRR